MGIAFSLALRQRLSEPDTGSQCELCAAGLPALGSGRLGSPEERAPRGVELEMVLDEGGVIGDDVLPGITARVALAGIAEKGFVTLELSARSALLSGKRGVREARKHD